MENSSTSKLWRFLNSPLIVVIVGVGLWSASSVMTANITSKRIMDKIMGRATNMAQSIRSPLDAMRKEEDKSALSEMDVARQIRVENVQRASGAIRNEERYIATLVNGSTSTVRDIWLSISFYGAGGDLLDVDDRSLRIPGAITPGETRPISISRTLGDYKGSDEVLARNASTTIKAGVKDLKIVQNP